MTVTGWIQIVVLIAVLTLLAPLLGGYTARVYQHDRIGLAHVLGPLERLLYRAVRVDESEEQSWVQYARSLLLFSAASWLALYVILRTHRVHPFNPQGFVHSGPFLSQAQNNGSAMAGYTGFIQPVAGNLGSHGIAFADLAGGVAPPGLGTLRTDAPTFVTYLVGFVVIVAVLTFLTALVLAPFAQALSSRMLG